MSEFKHHGIKGQKWGVRRHFDVANFAVTRSSAELSQLNETTKGYLAELHKVNSPVSMAQAKINLKANHEKFAAKFGPSEATSPTSPTSPTSGKD